MPSDKTYLDFVLDQLSELEEISYRLMMGEYILYYRGRIAGGIYDNRLLVKPVKAARDYLKDAPEEIPYEGAKPMLMVENIDDRDHLAGLFRAMWEELPVPKKSRSAR